MAKKEKDIFLGMTDDELLDQVAENPDETTAHRLAAFLLTYRLAQRQAAFNRWVTGATVVMAIQAVATLVAMFLL